MIRPIKRYCYAFLEKHFFEGCSRYNNLAVRRASRTKALAKTVFTEINAPQAKGIVFINPFRAFKFVKKHGFPVVLKPNFGTFSRGSFFPIRTMSEFWKALFLTKLFWPKTILEAYIEGKNYRVVVIKGKTMVVADRMPPFVIGDGKKTIETLIDKENETRESMGLRPVIFLLDKKVIVKYLKKESKSLADIPEKGEKIILGNLIALWGGGVLQDVPLDTIPPENHALFQKVLNAFEAEIFGLDFIAEKGIETPWNEQKCAFLEANSRPYLKMHDYPRWGKVPDLSADLAKLETLDIKDSDIF